MEIKLKKKFLLIWVENNHIRQILPLKNIICIKKSLKKKIDNEEKERLLVKK